ncbi:hypothetical protein [Algoriphagus sp.]|uniref:hypothetical protein n=1 Tax=Algoriphagus sp. TaxID=1872435 RepID=UPI00261C5972|nr:hypothetical protein [Algoriphagus sp.]
MLKKNWKPSLFNGSFIFVLASGVLFSACSEIESQPNDSSLSLAKEKITATHWENDPNFIILEADYLNTATKAELTENSRGVSSEQVKFDIELRFINEPTARQREVFESAVERWEKIIVRDEPDFTGLAIPNFDGSSFLVSEDEILDDIIIEVVLEPIDGPGSVLGSAGPRFIRLPEATTITGLMRFDTADLETLEAANQFENVILHEMGHVLGVGTLWERKSLLVIDSFEQAVDPDYLGERGNHFWKTKKGEGLLPIEGAFFRPDGTPFVRPGTSYGHWDEETLFNELMTGFLNGGVANPLSRITSGSMEDLGYGVAPRGEQYNLPATTPTRILTTDDNGINIAERELLFEPIGVVVRKQ